MKVKIRWLAYAVLITSLITTVTLSRYITTVSGKGTAAVANITMDGSFVGEGTSLDLSGIVPGETRTFSVEVVNYSDAGTGKRISDVAQSYSISLESTGNLPVSYTLTAEPPLKGQGTAATPWADPWKPGQGGMTITQADGLLPPAVEAAHQYTLTVSWPSDKNQMRYSYEVDAVMLKVQSKQVVD